MSEKTAADETGDARLQEASPGGKEKPSRAGKRRQRESRKKRKVVVSLVLAVVAVIAVGAVLDIPYINAAREAGSWAGGLFSRSEKEEEAPSEYLYFTHPRSGGKLQDEVSVLIGLYGAGGEGGAVRAIMALALFVYDTGGREGLVYLIPETSATYDADGQQIELKWVLGSQGGESLLVSTVGRMAGREVDYLLLLDFWTAVGMVQGLSLPPVFLDEEMVLVNPVNGETSFLIPGQRVGDADRLLAYLMATDQLEMWEALSSRAERARDYLPGALSLYEQVGLEDLQEMLLPLGGDYLLDPGTGSAEEDIRYLASMLQAFAALEEGRLTARGVPAVEVLNGCGIPDLGRQVGERLASLGVPVAGTGSNAKIIVDGEELNDFSHDTSTIIFRSADPHVEAFARYLGVLLAIEDIEFEPGPGPEMVLIAGRDLAA